MLNPLEALLESTEVALEAVEATRLEILIHECREAANDQSSQGIPSEDPNAPDVW